MNRERPRPRARSRSRRLPDSGGGARVVRAAGKGKGLIVLIASHSPGRTVFGTGYEAVGQRDAGGEERGECSGYHNRQGFLGSGEHAVKSSTSLRSVEMSVWACLLSRVGTMAHFPHEKEGRTSSCNKGWEIAAGSAFALGVAGCADS